MEIKFHLKDTFDLRKSEEHRGGMLSVAFSADGRSLFYGFNYDLGRIDLGERPSIKNARFGHKTTTRKCSEDESIASLKLSGNGRLLLVRTSGVIWWADDGKYFGEVLLVCPESLEIARKITFFESLTGFPEPHIISSAISSDAARVAVGKEKGEITIFKTGEEGAPAKIDADDDDVYTLVFSPDGNFLLGGYASGAVALWRTARGAAAKSTIKKGAGDCGTSGGNGNAAVTAAAFSRDGRFCATGRSDGVLQLWFLPLNKEPSSSIAHHPGRINCIAFSPCCRWLLSGGRGEQARAWTQEGLGYLGEVGGLHEGGVWSASFAPDGKHFALGHEDGICSLWTVEET